MKGRVYESMLQQTTLYEENFTTTVLVTVSTMKLPGSIFASTCTKTNVFPLNDQLLLTTAQKTNILSYTL